MAFDPSSINNLLFWFEPSKGSLYQDSGRTTAATADGDSVGSLTDNSANAIHFTASSTARPLLKKSIMNGQDVVRFDGTANTMSVASGGLWEGLQYGSLTLHFVFSMSSAPSFASILTKISSGDQRIQFLVNSAQFWRFSFTSSGSSVGAISTSTRYVVTYRYTMLNNVSGAVMGKEDIYVNGRLAYTRTGIMPAWNSSNNWRLGSNDTPAFFFAGDLGALICYQRAITETEREQVEAYLMLRYGITEQRNFVPANRTILHACGNSLTFGTNAVSNDWVSQMSKTINLPLTYLNYGISGQTTSQLSTNAATREDTFYVPGALNILTAWEITNELIANVSATTAYNNLVSYCQARQAKGFKVIVATCIPRNAGYSGGQTQSGFETARQTINANIVANWTTFADGLADVGGDATIGAAGAYSNTTYFSTDLIHLTAAGYAIAATYFQKAIVQLVGAQAQAFGLNMGLVSTSNNLSIGIV